MSRRLYLQITRFLNWLNGTNKPSVKDAVREAENHRREVQSRYGYGGDDGYSL